MNFMLKRSRRNRNAALLLFFVLLVLSGVKIYWGWSKVEAYARAVDLQAQGRDLEAEEAFLKVKSMRAIDYKEREVTEALSALRPVTELKRTSARLLADVDAALSANDVPTLVKTSEQWSQMEQDFAGKDEKARALFAQIASEYGVEQRMADAFAQVKTRLTAGLEKWTPDKNAADGERLLAYLLQIPAVYYADEKAKNAEMNRLAQKYGQARLSAVLKGSSVTEAAIESDRLHQLFTGFRLDSSWIAGRLEPFIQGVLSAQLEKNDVKGFLANVRIVQEHPAVLKQGSKTDAYIRTSVQKLLTRGRQLADSRKFQDAIDLYTLLGSYQNTEKEIRDTEQRWMEAEPSRLLGKAAGEDRDFSYMVSVKGKWGAKAAAAGLAENQTLILARLLQDGAVDKAEIGIGKGVTITSIRIVDSIGSEASPMLLLEAASKSRKSRYLVYAAEQQVLRLLLDVEADGYEVIRKGVLQLDNPSGEGSGSKALYEYRDKELRKVQQQPPQTGDKLVSVSDLPNVRSETVRFECEIVTVDGSNALARDDGNRYVLLAGGGKPNWKRGPALITGTYDGAEEMKLDGQTVSVYKVHVLEAGYP